ncbi:hypothetical protein [Rubrivirga sp. SAORIC476]|uniref:hypothetical protein n=1 Tax=Rubrivirga sp. SAORIC476 TaxID=1961794 RepID=UPI001179FC0C|nr:hypothetical protein [Rubrivirga sp. SAORIC476]
MDLVGDRVFGDDVPHPVAVGTEHDALVEFSAASVCREQPKLRPLVVLRRWVQMMELEGVRVEPTAAVGTAPAEAFDFLDLDPAPALDAHSVEARLAPRLDLRPGSVEVAQGETLPTV